MVQTGLERSLLKKKSAFEELIGYHEVNIKMGAFCSLLTIVLLYVLLTNKDFRRRRKLIITLAAADLLNCVGILLMGVDRTLLYGNVVKTGHFDVETSWSCAHQFWLLVKTAGDIWPPIVQCLMGTEQLLSTYSKKPSKRRSELLVLASCVFVIGVVTSGYILAFSSRFNGPVKYYCGRKATFGRIYSGFIYGHNVVGYISGVLLNSIALHRMKNEKRTFSACLKQHVQQVQQIRSCLIVSTISTILVSIPNSLSLFSLLVSSVKDSISKPAVWATCINSGVNLFVYAALDKDFQHHIVHLWKREAYSTVCLKEEERHQLRLFQCDSRAVTIDSIVEENALHLQLEKAVSSEPL